MMNRPDLTMEQLRALNVLDLSFLKYGYGPKEKQMYIARVLGIPGMTRKKAEQLWHYEVAMN